MNKKLIFIFLSIISNIIGISQLPQKYTKEKSWRARKQHAKSIIELFLPLKKNNN